MTRNLTLTMDEQFDLCEILVLRVAESRRDAAKTGNAALRSIYLRQADEADAILAKLTGRDAPAKAEAA